MNYSAVKLISFDLDNTLYDNNPVIKLAEEKSRQYLQSEFEKCKKIFDYEVFIQSRNEFLQWDKKNSTPLYEDLSFLRQQLLLKCCEVLPEQKKIAQQAFDIFIDYRNRVIVEDRVTSMLNHLQVRYKLVSVTNGNCDASRLSISNVFDKNYSPSYGYRAKPHPEMLYKIFKDFGLQPEQVLHIGDSLDSDGEVARQSGCLFHFFDPFRERGLLSKNCDTLLNQLKRG